MELVEIRVRTRIPKSELDKKVGKIITDKDFNVLLTGPTKVVGPSGQPLAIYLPAAIPESLREANYLTLHGIRAETENRGRASGSQAYEVGRQMRSNRVKSSIIGSFDRYPRTPYCRTTAWTGKNTEKFRSMYPLFQHIGHTLESYVPERWANQMLRAKQTDPAWIVEGTPFTTMTVNNTYPTGVHMDKGDLDEGFSCLATWRRGQYSGGFLTFPEWRFAVNMQDGDLMLMDAHQWHGNTDLVLGSEDAERISLVLYYRTKMMACGTLEEETAAEYAAKKKVISA